MTESPDHQYREYMQFVQKLLRQGPQQEYIAIYHDDLSNAELVIFGLTVTLAAIHRRPLYLLVHHGADVPPAFVNLAHVVESYGHDGDDENHATVRMLRRIEQTRHDPPRERRR